MKPPPSRPVRKRRFVLLLAGAVLVWLGVTLVAGDSGALAFVRARDRLGDLDARVKALEAENARLRAEIRRLGRDPRATERLAREELAMARPDEEVILVPDPKAAAPPPAAPAVVAARSRAPAR